MDFADSSSYDGEWSSNIMHGQGKHVTREGHVYEGGFRENKYHGKGKIEYKTHSEPSAQPSCKYLISLASFIDIFDSFLCF